MELPRAFCFCRSSTLYLQSAAAQFGKFILCRVSSRICYEYRVPLALGLEDEARYWETEASRHGRARLRLEVEEIACISEPVSRCGEYTRRRNRGGTGPTS